MSGTKLDNMNQVCMTGTAGAEGRNGLYSSLIGHEDWVFCYMMGQGEKKGWGHVRCRFTC